MKEKFIKISKTILLLIFVSQLSFGQKNVLQGTIIDGRSNLPLEGATIRLLPENISTITNQLGKFSFQQLKGNASAMEITSVGYSNKSISIEEFKKMNFQASLIPQSVELTSVIISSNAGDQLKAISRTDIAMRGINNSQEVLRLIPGVVIGQHQGGGKAEQIFSRGFDCDHGTDLRLEVDGLPINMVSHAHGQGYADSHFIIPETIESADSKKGTYTASKGDFATTGFVGYNLKDAIPNNLIKLEGGQFNTSRALGMFNLLKQKAKDNQQSWYAASEYRYSDAYFVHPQNFNRFNLFTKYKDKISRNNYLTLSASTFWSKWNASGQIPDRAVEKGIIGFYGALDPNEGGITSRTNVNAQLITSFQNGNFLKNQVFYSHYDFDLHSNFTFFLEDPVNGDEIRQKEGRNLFGYNGSFHHISYSGNMKLSTEAGLQIRTDMTNNSELSHTQYRYTLLNRIKLGDITGTSISPYISETLKFNEYFSINAGLRFDQFFHHYKNKFADDNEFSGVGIYKAKANILSPKLNFYYQVDNSLQFYLTTGKSFHSNDTRAAVAENGMQILPAAYSADFGTVFKPAKNVLMNAAIWYSYLEQEFVYGGDGGSIDFSGKTQRKGFDFSSRYEPLKSLYLDLDVNYAHARAMSISKGDDYIPLAPVWTSSAGITYAAKGGLNGSLRYRFVSDRPANEDYSLTAKGYFITDAVLHFTRKKYEIGLSINNILNTKWKETQFATETRLKNETFSVDEICFTPGTPFAATLSLSFIF